MPDVGHLYNLFEGREADGALTAVKLMDADLQKYGAIKMTLYLIYNLIATVPLILRLFHQLLAHYNITHLHKLLVAHETQPLAIGCNLQLG